jgi:hypothetical protein
MTTNFAPREVGICFKSPFCDFGSGVEAGDASVFRGHSRLVSPAEAERPTEILGNLFLQLGDAYGG